ncbi:helix-turn-helix domain-containing protein [Geomicrobium sediminis]|uniref:Transcriptional regulator with XRE-family HTH domain n=1 Tax=Geomicrobium sediminis TaxID=1347788 RepID=A0ABS2PGT3_9BACL|nr:helix-turn-helix transcriptional regulator [Geomicrobium sediminis]MBM7634033.1 transcriptional regulator with XRE-family HTH domain [Geomicrobium sediminis]
MKYGGAMRALRKKAGYNQEEWAEINHMTQSDVSKYENNRKEPAISVFQTWCTNAQAPEVMVALIIGVDGIGMMTQIMELLPQFTSITGFISLLF